MQISHRIDDFLYTIFPEIRKGDLDGLKQAISDYYTIGAFKPLVAIEDGWVRISLDMPAIVAQEPDYRKVIQLCEKGQFAAAKPILNKLIQQNPTNSEYHRIMGQILSDEGDQEEAINSLIYALRWDSRNGWALLMMGNIFAKYKNDVETAMKYYDQALIANPKDNISINNIGANLMQQGKLEEAKKYFWEALRINDQYPNTHFALGMIADIEGDLPSAFYSTVQAIKTNKPGNPLYVNSLKQAFDVARKLIATREGEQAYNTYKDQLEALGNRKIEILQDNEIPTAAKFEFAENYKREAHIVRYRPDFPAVEHLIAHELTHLELVLEAREKGLNQLFTSNQTHRSEFIKGLGKSLDKLRKLGLSEQTIAEYASNLFEGINRQIFNAPIDLFIENHLYQTFPELRPYQFISWYNLLQESIKAVTDKQVVEVSPADILSKSKVYNMVGALQFKALYGIDLIDAFKATAQEANLANKFFSEYNEYKDDREPAEEYELVLHWAEDLKLDKLFELVDEESFRNKRSDVNKLLESIEEDPYDVNTRDPYKEREMDKFRKSQEQIGLNMAVVMFMVEALQFFQGRAREEVKKIAFEIAMLGTQGYRPDKTDYKINSMPGKTFSGYHILAYYYVSWALAAPEMLPKLELPYDEEYAMAKQMFQPPSV
jgi:Tfp pilus assembly protein PilF